MFEFIISELIRIFLRKFYFSNSQISIFFIISTYITLTKLNSNSIFDNFIETKSFFEFAFDIEVMTSAFNRKNRDQFISNVLNNFQNSIIARRMFSFNEKMYDISSHYFRLFTFSNIHIHLLNSIDIQNKLKKITFRKNLNHELDDSN